MTNTQCPPHVSFLRKRVGGYGTPNEIEIGIEIEIDSLGAMVAVFATTFDDIVVANTVTTAPGNRQKQSTDYTDFF